MLTWQILESNNKLTFKDKLNSLNKLSLEGELYNTLIQFYLTILELSIKLPKKCMNKIINFNQKCTLIYANSE